MRRLALPILGAVMVFTAIVAGTLIANRRSVSVEPARAASSADLTVKEANIREESGSVRWHLTAKQATVFDSEGRTSLREVAVEVQEPGRSWTIRGDEGDLFHHRNDIELRGSVVLTSGDGLRLEASVLRWTNGDRRLWTDVPVRITHPSGVITGSGLDVRMADDTTTVSGRVRATFDQRSAS